jgi:glutaredoxin
MAVVRLFTAPNCTLCESTKLVLQAARLSLSFELQEVDITQSLRGGDRVYFDRYRHRIPVVEVNGHEVDGTQFTHMWLEGALLSTPRSE